MAGAFKKSYFISRGQSPWQGYTSDYQQEQAGKTIAAATMTSALEAVPHLASYTANGVPWLAIDRAHKCVVVNATLFGTLRRPDVTRMRAGEKVQVGKIVAPALLENPRLIVAFLLESQLIETYQHLEATVELLDENDAPDAYQAAFRGTHLYFTNDRHEGTYSFRVSINKKNGEILVSGE